MSGQGLISAAGRNSRVQLLPPEVCHDTQQGLQWTIHQPRRERCSELNKTYGASSSRWHLHTGCVKEHKAFKVVLKNGGIDLKGITCLSLLTFWYLLCLHSYSCCIFQVIFWNFCPLSSSHPWSVSRNDTGAVSARDPISAVRLLLSEAAEAQQRRKRQRCQAQAVALSL